MIHKSVEENMNTVEFLRDDSSDLEIRNLEDLKKIDITTNDSVIKNFNKLANVNWNLATLHADKNWLPVEKLNLLEESLEVLKEKIKNTQSNYLLTKKIEAIVDIYGLDKPSQHEDIPFKPYNLVQVGNYQYLDRDTKKITPNKQEIPNTLQKLEVHYEQLNEQLYFEDSFSTREDPNYVVHRANVERIKQEMDTLRQGIQALTSINFNDLVFIKQNQNNNFDIETYLNVIDTKVYIPLEKDMEVPFFDLSVKEQFFMLDFIKNKNQEEMIPVIDFAKTFKKQGLKTFLSLEHDTSLGDKIIELGDSLPEDVVKQIFSKYAELVDLTDSVGEYVQQFQNNNQENQDKGVSIAQVSEKLLIRAKDILVHSLDKKPEEILKMLDTVKADAELFKSTFLIEKKNGGVVSLENIRDAQFENKKSSELSDDEKQSMRVLYAKNYASNPVFQKVLLESFDKSLENPKTTFYLFKIKNEIKGFDRFDDLGDGKKYFGSFNIDESIQGATLGESMIDQSVNVEAKTGEIIADCSAVNRIGARYIENGFVAVSFTENYYGVPAFSIIRNDPETVQLFRTKQMSEDDLESLVTHPRNDIRVFQGETQDELLPIFSDKVGKGYVLTRYFQNPASKKWNVVLEQVTV